MPLKVNAGDIIAIPAMKNMEPGFVLCRIIDDRAVVTTGEIFRNFYTDFSLTEEEIRNLNLSVKDRMCNPVYISLHFTKNFGKIRWPILLRDEHYDKERDSRFSEVEFQTNEYEENGFFLRANKECYEPPGVRRNLTDRQIYSNPQLIQLVNSYLSGDLKIGEPSNLLSYKKLIKKYGLTWLGENLKFCKELSDRIATQFQEVRRKNKRLTTRKTPKTS